jgi:hypothetical protein
MQKLGWSAATLAALGCLGFVQTALAADAPSAQKRPVCLRSYLVDHTQIKDDRTILFYMRDHKVWANALANECPGLLWDDGYTYEPTISATQEICDNLVIIRVNRTGEVCQLGAFTQIPPAPVAN